MIQFSVVFLKFKFEPILQRIKPNLHTTKLMLAPFQLFNEILKHRDPKYLDIFVIIVLSTHI